MHKLIFTETYQKKEQGFLKRHPDLIERYKKTLKLLELTPNHQSLRLHKLKGKFSDKYAISITYSYRIILAFAIVDTEIVLIDIGHHDEVY